MIKHQNTIKLVEHFQDDHNDYYIQELCEGGDLKTYMDRCGRLTENQAKAIFKQIFEAIVYLHSKKIAHRDIKP
jgi:serine/threonine protein kinase